jgi:hypothetical protein
MKVSSVPCTNRFPEAVGRRRVDPRAEAGGDSPSEYLRRWVAHRAARHRGLLLTISAAPGRDAATSRRARFAEAAR